MRKRTRERSYLFFEVVCKLLCRVTDSKHERQLSIVGIMLACRRLFCGSARVKKKRKLLVFWCTPWRVLLFSRVNQRMVWRRLPCAADCVVYKIRDYHSNA